MEQKSKIKNYPPITKACGTPQNTLSLPDSNPRSLTHKNHAQIHTIKKSKKSPQSKLTPLHQQIFELKKQLPPQQDWRTTDEQEIIRRQVRALENPPAIRQTSSGDKIHATFQVTSNDSDHTYQVEIIDLSLRLFHSTTPDFATNGLNTCKHTEAVLYHLQKRYPRLYKTATKTPSPHHTLIILNNDIHLH